MAKDEPVTNHTSVDVTNGATTPMMGNAGGRTHTQCHVRETDKRNGGGSVQNHRRIEECYSPM